MATADTPSVPRLPYEAADTSSPSVVPRLPYEDEAEEKWKCMIDRVTGTEERAWIKTMPHEIRGQLPAVQRLFLESIFQGKTSTRLETKVAWNMLVAPNEYTSAWDRVTIFLDQWKQFYAKWVPLQNLLPQIAPLQIDQRRYVWVQLDMSREKANDVLSIRPKGCALLRPSETSPGDLCLSCNNSEAVTCHYLIKVEPGKVKFAETDRPQEYRSVAALLEDIPDVVTHLLVYKYPQDPRAPAPSKFMKLSDLAFMLE